MTSVVHAAVLAAVIAVPAVSSADARSVQQPPLTRAEVREQLVQLRAAGYDPDDWIDYPQNLQAAQARVDAQQANGAYGPGTNGSTQTGE